MSRSYRISVRESSSRVIKAEDSVSTHLEVLEVLPGEPLMQKPDAFGCNLGDYT